MISSPSLDVDIYENVRQIFLCQLFSEVWFFCLWNTLKILTYVYNEKSCIYWRKRIISLKPFDIEKFALHFHKCPHLGKDLMPLVDIFNQHLFVIPAFTFAQYEMTDPVLWKDMKHHIPWPLETVHLWPRVVKESVDFWQSVLNS